MRYEKVMLSKSSAVHAGAPLVAMFPSMLRHPMTEVDRLGNPLIKFPIGIAYGTLDAMSSAEGAEQILLGNCHKETGRSQLFLVDDCSHEMLQEQPDEMFRIMTGFFEGTIQNTWEPKEPGMYNGVKLTK